MGGARCSGVGAWEPSAMPFTDRRRGVDSFQYSVSGKRAGANRRRQKSRRLQWSPTSSGRETSLGDTRPETALRWASMEPYPFRQGNLLQAVRQRVLQVASMEPYPFRQGNSSTPRMRSASSSMASMEPYPFRQGNRRRQGRFLRDGHASMEPYPFRQGN